jgi:hypothetical protein
MYVVEDQVFYFMTFVAHIIKYNLYLIFFHGIYHFAPQPVLKY